MQLNAVVYCNFTLCSGCGYVIALRCAHACCTLVLLCVRWLSAIHVNPFLSLSLSVSETPHHIWRQAGGWLSGPLLNRSRNLSQLWEFHSVRGASWTFLHGKRYIYRQRKRYPSFSALLGVLRKGCCVTCWRRLVPRTSCSRRLWTHNSNPSRSWYLVKPVSQVNHVTACSYWYEIVSFIWRGYFLVLFLTFKFYSRHIALQILSFGIIFCQFL